MGPSDSCATFGPALTSRSYEPMDYAACNVRYQEDFNINKTRPRHGSKELQHSMLAYTNYVVERQHQNAVQQPGIHTRQSPTETNENMHGPKVSNESKFPGVNLPYSKLPSLHKSKFSGVPKLSERYNRFRGEQGILRGNTFPPLGEKESHKPKKLSVRISVANVSDLYDVTNKTRCDARVTEVINHEKMHAWLAEDNSTTQPDLSNILTTSKPAIRKHFEVSRSLDSVTLDQEKTSRPKSEGDIQMNKTDAKKLDKEKLLKSAIKTLKMMEKELEELPKKEKEVEATERLTKKKKSPKKSKRLKLPEQTLDIIPELACETVYPTSPDAGYSTEASMVCVHNTGSSNTVGADCAYKSCDLDAVVHEIDKETGEYVNSGALSVRSEDKTVNLGFFSDSNGLAGKGIRGESVLMLPPINRHQKSSSGKSKGGLNFGQVSKLDKVKSDIRSKIKRRQKHLK